MFTGALGMSHRRSGISVYPSCSFILQITSQRDKNDCTISTAGKPSVNKTTYKSVSSEHPWLWIMWAFLAGFGILKKWNKRKHRSIHITWHWVTDCAERQKVLFHVTGIVRRRCFHGNGREAFFPYYKCTVNKKRQALLIVCQWYAEGGGRCPKTSALVLTREIAEGKRGRLFMNLPSRQWWCLTQVLRVLLSLFLFSDCSDLFLWQAWIPLL